MLRIPRQLLVLIPASLAFFVGNLLFRNALLGSDVWIFTYFGFLFAQFSLIVVWQAFAPGSLVTRLPFALLLASLALLAMNWGIRWEGEIVGGIAVSNTGVAALSSLGTSLLLVWSLRRWSGWRLAVGQQPTRETSQFSLMELIKGTTAIILVLVCGQLALSDGQGFAWPRLSWHEAASYGVIAVSHVLVAMVSFALMMCRVRLGPSLILGMLVVVVVAAVNAAFSGGLTGEYLIVEVSHFAVLMLVFGALRRSGFRLTRDTPGSVATGLPQPS